MGFRKRHSAEPDRGLMMPVAWYFWPDEADPVYGRQLERWRSDYAAGIDYPPPLRDLNRTVSLEGNMPPELEGLSVPELTPAGVKVVPGEQAAEFILGRFEIEHGVALDASQQVAYLRNYLELIGAPTPP